MVRAAHAAPHLHQTIKKEQVMTMMMFERSILILKKNLRHLPWFLSGFELKSQKLARRARRAWSHWDGDVTLVSINEIVDDVVVHKSDPRLNILSTKFKTNEIKAEKFDWFVVNKFLKPASDYVE